MGLMVSGAHLLGESQETHLFETLGEKMEFQDLAVEGWFAVLLSGIAS